MTHDTPQAGNFAFYRLLREANLKPEALARAVNLTGAGRGVALATNRSTVSQWLSRGRIPHPQTVAFVCEVLSDRLGRAIQPADLGFTTGDADPPADPLTELRSLGRAEAHRRTLLINGVFSVAALLAPLRQQSRPRALHAAAGNHIGQPEVEAVLHMLHAFDSLDERLGGGHGRSALVEYLTNDVAAFCRAPATQAVRVQMQAAATQLAYLAGWKAHDLQLEGLAQRYYLLAHELATAAGDGPLAAYVLRILAHQAYDVNRPEHCLDLAQTAARAVRGQVDPHTEAVFTMTIARAYAVTGDKARTVAAISRAERLDDRARDTDTRPGWPKMRANHGQFHSHAAKSLQDIGDLAAAERHFQLAYTERDPVTHPLISGLSQAWLAECQFQRGNLAGACANWAGARQRFTGIQSERATETLRTMRVMLAPLRGRGIAEVNALLSPA